MVKRRGLKDAARDPLAHKATAAVQAREPLPKPTSNLKASMFKTVAALAIGFAIGVFTGRYVKVW